MVILREKNKLVRCNKYGHNVCDVVEFKEELYAIMFRSSGGNDNVRILHRRGNGSYSDGLFIPFAVIKWCSENY